MKRLSLRLRFKQAEWNAADRQAGCGAYYPSRRRRRGLPNHLAIVVLLGFALVVATWWLLNPQARQMFWP